MRRLYWRVYGAFVGIAVACLLAATAVAWSMFDERSWPPPELAGGLRVIGEVIPEGGPRQHRAMRRFAEELDADLTMRAADGELVTHVGTVIPQAGPGVSARGRRAVLRVTLEDGRELAAAGRGHLRPSRPPFALVLVVVGGVVAAGVWPLARSVTRPLEGLQAGVQAWGDGDLGARAPASGKDEVAQVARTFNAAADRIEALVKAQQRSLASASHELRTPLTRMRMALELIRDGQGDPDALVDQAVRDIEELDRTVGDLLAVGRMQAVGLSTREPVSLRTLLEEEGAHVGATVEGPPFTVAGDVRLLRRLVRNLLENAVRHGGGEVTAFTTADGLVVADRGPGIPAGQREAVLEPFHRPQGHDEGVDGGVGLGLWLVSEIARAHGGRVHIGERAGGGAEVTVSLPRAGSVSAVS